MPVNVAFHTRGDSHELIPAHNGRDAVTDTHAFEYFARRAAGNLAFSADDPGMAMIPLRSVTAGSVQNFYFYGHGAGENGDFVFNGVRNAQGGFVTQGGRRALLIGSSDNASRYFILRMAQLATRGARVTVHAQFCWSARGPLLRDIAEAFNHAGVTQYTLSGLYPQGRVGAALRNGAVHYTIGPPLQRIISR